MKATEGPVIRRLISVGAGRPSEPVTKSTSNHPRYPLAAIRSPTALPKRATVSLSGSGTTPGPTVAPW